MKLSTILIIIIVFLSTGLLVSYTQWQKNKDRADRMETNYKDIVKDNNEQNLTYKELNKQQKQRIDRLVDSVKIKPKKALEYVYITIKDTIHDTIEVRLTLTEPFTYEFTKDTACFHIEGLVNNKNKIPKLQFTELDYNNTVEYLVYQQRKKWKFLFIQSRFLGKKQNELQTFSKCGESTTQKINIIKK